MYSLVQSLTRGCDVCVIFLVNAVANKCFYQDMALHIVIYKTQLLGNGFGVQHSPQKFFPGENQRACSHANYTKRYIYIFRLSHFTRHAICRTHHHLQVVSPRLMHCLGSLHDTNEGIFFPSSFNFCIWAVFLNLSQSFKQEIRLDQKYAILQCLQRFGLSEMSYLSQHSYKL